jgi:hypothetical protein
MDPIRNPKSEPNLKPEIRSPEIRRKSEIRNPNRMAPEPCSLRVPPRGFGFRPSGFLRISAFGASDFGFGISDFLRISARGFRISDFGFPSDFGLRGFGFPAIP